MINQQSHFFQSNQHWLFGELFIPIGKHHSKGYVICAPFAEEKKSAHRTLVDMAVRLCENGYPVLLFDYAGCGDSTGDFCNTTLSLWINDIYNAIDFFKQETGIENIGLIGLRLGAFLMVQPEVSFCNEYILIEPVINLSRYFKQILRQKLMKELITDGQVSSNRNQLIKNLDEKQNIDFDGYEISPLFHSELKQYSGLEEYIPRLNKPTLFLHISHIDKMSRVVAKLHPLLTENKSISFQLLKLDPFWDRIENVYYAPMLETVINFCTRNHD